MNAVNEKKNAGEWAELYVLLKVLSEGNLYGADGDLNKLDDNFFPVISIEMQKTGQPKDKPIPINYVVNRDEGTVDVTSEGVSSTIKMSELDVEANSFFNIISTRKGRSFQVPEVNPLLKKILNPITKKSSSNKADIHIVIHDVMTGAENEVGFSIKSKHSSSATLINPSGQTLFQYRIESRKQNINVDVNDVKNSLAIIDVNNKKVGAKDRIQKLLASGYDLKFTTIKGDTFKENIQLIDSSLDIFLAECLKVFMSKRISSLSEIIEIVSGINPCGFSALNEERLLDFYRYKMKRLVVDSALGMLPGTPWSGKYDASGGYIVVKELGEVVCYHLYNWNALQDYLYKSLKFDTPSSTSTGSKKSFNYASYYSQNEEHFVDICLQLRFK